jgi:hypothetical protein
MLGDGPKSGVPLKKFEVPNAQKVKPKNDQDDWNLLEGGGFEDES